MAFANIFRRHSGANETQGANYACLDANSTTETLLDELEIQCQNSSTLTHLRKKRNSEAFMHEGGLLAATYDSSSKRRSSVDYSWLTPQNNLLQTPQDLYHLPDIIKMELNELIQQVAPEDCASVVNTFRRQLRSQAQVTTPESIIALFRKILSSYNEHKQKHRSNSIEKNNISSKITKSIIRNNRILPNHQSEEELHSIAELNQISISSRPNDSSGTKPRANTYV